MFLLYHSPFYSAIMLFLLLSFILKLCKKYSFLFNNATIVIFKIIRYNLC